MHLRKVQLVHCINKYQLGFFFPVTKIIKKFSHIWSDKKHSLQIDCDGYLANYLRYYISALYVSDILMSVSTSTYVYYLL